MTDTYANVPDGVRIAYQWLSAQQRTKGCMRLFRPLKHVIEAWGGRYVSKDDVAKAARLLGLKGNYPYFDISGSFTWPDERRLDDIAEALTMMNYREGYTFENSYKRRETLA